MQKRLIKSKCQILILNKKMFVFVYGLIDEKIFFELDKLI